MENAIQEEKIPTQEAGSAAQASGSNEAPESVGAEASTTEVPSDAGEQAAVNNAVGSQSPVSELTKGVEGETGQPSDRRFFREPPQPKPTVYVGNLFFDVTENDLQKEFARFGTIKNVRLIKDVRGLSKG